VDRRGLQTLSRIRLREAKALLGLGLHDGAYYLAGYAVECALKACIAKQTHRYEFPEKGRVDASYTHNLKELTKVANLEASLLERAKDDEEFDENWELLRRWSERSRYTRHTPEDAEALVAAAANRYHGIVPWIRQHW
jgi:HEPN domain-containing protein